MGQSVTQAPNRFVYLDFLRFAFAMVVFFGHAKAYLALPKAELAVDYFFILSGFVLTHAYKDRVLAPQFLASFIRDRVARLYPLHLATLAVLVFFNIWFLEVTNGQWLEQGWSYQDGRTYTLSLSLLLLNNVGLTPSGPSWNAPAWSISVELWVNILLAVLAVVSRRHFIRLCAAAFLGCYLILFVYVGALGDFYRNIGPLNTGILRGLAGMSAGIICYAVYRALLPVLPGKITVIAIAVALVLLQFWLIAGGIAFKHSDFLIVPASGVTVIAVALAETHHRGTRYDGALEWLGECSYAIYMTHWIVLVFINYFLIYAWRLDINLHDPVHFISVVVAVLVLSRLSFVLIERPGKRFIRGLSKRRESRGV